MRLTSVHVIFVLAACSSTACASSDESVETSPLTCSGSVADYCTAHPCDRDLATAKQDPRLCPASQIRCGDYDVILSSGIGASTNYYYRGGELVAIEQLVFPGHATCLGEPLMFDKTQCAATHRRLPACS